ncbi:MAG: prepilin-type N-terminal cleavage/methylation domain-containing protein [Rubrivivax sp.]|nr:prepilin-type N-terminal cleavage/methylation domain-containing protein [Rubrivivax sp.]
MSPSALVGAPMAARRGFTIIELGLVLALLGVLMGLAIPAWSGWKDKARTKQATEDIISISVVIDQHLADTGTLPADLAAISRGGLKDPWGNGYEYLPLIGVKGNGKARKDHSLVPLNSDYDLYSKGPDGASVGPLTAKASRDDILRANNGRFVGPASMY